MNEAEFSDLQPYFEAQNQCISYMYDPRTSLVKNGWIREVVVGAFQITPKGIRAFQNVIDGRSTVTEGGYE